MGSPFEWLRSVARGRSDEDHLPSEAASALASLAHDPAQLVVACRRLLDHHRSNGALWWVASHMLASPEPAIAARRCHDLLTSDRTASRLRDALPLCNEGETVGAVGWAATIGTALEERFDIDVVAIVDQDHHVARRQARERAALIEPWQLVTSQTTLLLVSALAATPTQLLVSRDAQEAIIEAPSADVWVIMSVGRLVAPRIFEAIGCATQSDEAVTVIDYPRVSKVISSRAVDVPADLASRLDCPIAPELLRPF